MAGNIHIPQSEEDARALIAATADLDSAYVIREVRRVLKPGATILELGSGSGRDLRILADDFEVTGSDVSTAVVRVLRKEVPDIDILHLDAAAPETPRKFDLVFSNKVMHQLPVNRLGDAFRRHIRLLLPGGCVFHTFWQRRRLTRDFVRHTANRIFGNVTTRTYDDLSAGDSYVLIAGDELP